MKSSNDPATKVEPSPTGEGTDVTAELIKDLQARSDMGKQKYGTVLRTNNGRDALVDALQESLDLVVYLKQELLEREEFIQKLAAEIENETREIIQIGGLRFQGISWTKLVQILEKHGYKHEAKF